MLARLHPLGMDTAITAAAVAAAAIYLAVTGIPVAARVILAVPLLVAPGFLLTSALFPRGKLDTGERAVLTAGLSVSIVVLLGLLLNELPEGLTRGTWEVSLAIASVGAYLINLVTGRHAEGDSSSRSRVSLIAVITAVVALLCVFAGLGIARQSAIDHGHRTHFTQLWALPTHPGSNGARGVNFGVTNHERGPRKYVLVVQAKDGTSLETLSFRLAPGRTHTGRLRLGKEQAVTLDLYVGQRLAGSPYRQVRLWSAS